jgi:hypothetical protein
MPDAARRFDPAVADDLAALLVEISNNKETRAIVGKAIRKVKPDSAHAKAFADVDVDDRFENFKAEQEAKDLKRQQDAIVANMQRARDRLLTGGPDGSGRKYAEDDVKKIEALMEKKGLTDYDDAAVLYAATLPPENLKPAGGPPVNNTTWEFPPEFEEYAKDPAKAARNAANGVITEFMRKR